MITYRNMIMLAIGAMLLSACCGEVRYSQEVNVSSLYELPVPLVQSKDDLAELDIFDRMTPYRYGYLGEWLGGEISKHPDFYGVKVNLDVHPDSQSAANSFTYECRNPLFRDSSEIEYGGDGENQYCISYVKEIRGSVDTFCMSTGKYVSFVVFLKGNLVIAIREETRDKDSTVKDDVIELLAQELGK